MLPSELLPLLQALSGLCREEDAASESDGASADGDDDIDGIADDEVASIHASHDHVSQVQAAISCILLAFITSMSPTACL